MKLNLMMTILLITGSAFGSGSTIGNGFTANSYTKEASLVKSKTPEKLCTENKDAVLEKDKGEEVCKFKDGTVKMKDLLEAAKKNDAGKK